MNFAGVFAFLAWASTVLARGPKTQLPSCYPLDQPAGGPKPNQPDIDCEKCRIEAKIQVALTGKATHIPQCIAKTNKFAPKQCHAGFCWCSTPYGIEIPNTKTKKNLNCNKKPKPSHNCKKRAPTVGFKPTCNGEDFWNTQCMDGFCWCYTKDGHFVPNTIYRINQKNKPCCRKLADLRFKCGNRSGLFKFPFDTKRYIECAAGGIAWACSCPTKTTFDPKKKICRNMIEHPRPHRMQGSKSRSMSRPERPSWSYRYKQSLKLRPRFTGHIPKHWSALKNSPPLQFANLWTKNLLKFVKGKMKFRPKGQKSVAIVGAGPAGLTAAYELSKYSNLNITIFEKSHRVGGRVLTVGEIGGFKPGAFHPKGCNTKKSRIQNPEFRNITPWNNDCLQKPTYGEAGAMRLPLIPDVLAKNKWDISKLSDADINDLVQGKKVGKSKAKDTDFPMPLIRHYIKKFKVPVRRFNMCPTIANVDVKLEKANNCVAAKTLEDIFVNENDRLKATPNGNLLDDHVLTFLEADDEIRAWMNSRGVNRTKQGNNLHDIFDHDLTKKAAMDLTDGNLTKKINGDDYLDWITLSSWNKFLRKWDKTYRKHLKEQKWPERLIDFYGDIYRTDMSSKVNVEITEDELGHWWQPNMFTLKYGMHSLYDAPFPKKNFPKKHFHGFRQTLDEKKNTKILFGKEVTKITGSKKKARVFLDKSEKEYGKFDYVLVTVPMFYIKKIKFDGDFKDLKLDALKYTHYNLGKKLYQFREPFWKKPENNLGNFNVTNMKGFAVIASSNQKPHLTQFRYSNPKYEGNVILAYETGGPDAKLLEKMKDEKVLEYIQKKFQTKQAHVKKNAYCLPQPRYPHTGKYKKAWLHLSDTSVSPEEVSQKQKFCSKNQNRTKRDRLLFAGDDWSYKVQWQEGAMSTAIHAVFRILNSASGANRKDPFQYSKD